MALQTTPETSVTEMIAGIVEDFQKLVSQQLSLLRAEVASDWRKVKRGLWPVAVGAGLSLISVMLFSFMLVYLLQWLSRPAEVVDIGLPLWACYAIVAATFGVIGGLLLAVGARWLGSFNPLPNETAASLEENVKWIANGKNHPN